MVALVVALRPVSENLYYNIPDGIKEKVKSGIRVLVPIGRSKTVAFVKRVSLELPEGFPENVKMKEIEKILDEEDLISPKMFHFFEWLKEYYFYPPGEIIKGAVPNLLSRNKSANISKRLVSIEDSSCSGRQAPGNAPQVQVRVEIVKELNERQKALVKEILRTPEDGKRRPILLHGVTGSGKTQVYIESIRSIVAQGKEALVLVPEISLTPQLVARFRRYFDDRLVVFHSALTEKERLCEWLKIKYRKASIAVGVRSAIFLPFTDLGIIVVDEEHENTFKQDERLKYNARDLAILRGKLEEAVVVLGSATPSLETYYRAECGDYQLLTMSGKACQKYPPEVKIIDLRRRNIMFGDTMFSVSLFEEMVSNLKRGKQTLLFLNRTGYSNFVLCLKCGAPAKCPNCSISLIYYRSTETMRCPYCDFRVSRLTECPACKSESLKFVGTGTEQIEEDLKKHLPSARIARMDRETTAPRGTRERIISDLSQERIDILVGTQMIARGLDFHRITLAGVILADTILGIPDFKSSERTFQLVAQVSGRPGRGIYPGKVFIQTYNPDHYAIKFAEKEDYRGFYKKELSFRKELNYPPFSRLASIRISGNVERVVIERSKEVADNLNRLISGNHKWRMNISLLGPAPRALYRIRNRFRYHILLKSKSPVLSNALLKTLIKNEAGRFHSGGVKVSFDIDPVSLM